MGKGLNQKAITELTVYWTKVQPEVANFVSLMVPSFHDAEDVLQQVAVALVKKFHEFDRREPFRNWAIGIAKYEILAYRRRKARDRHVFDEALMEQVADAYEKTRPMLEEAREGLAQCMEKVQGRNRRLLEMWYRDGIDQVRIAQQLSTTPNTIYVALHRVRTALRDCVGRHLRLAGESP